MKFSQKGIVEYANTRKHLFLVVPPGTDTPTHSHSLPLRSKDYPTPPRDVLDLSHAAFQASRKASDDYSIAKHAVEGLIKFLSSISLDILSAF